MALSRRSMTVLAAVAAVVLVGGGVLLWRLRSAPSTPTGPRLVFAEFAPTADRIYLAPAADPAQRTLVTTVDHVAEWGLNPALNLGGTKLAYTVLPASTVRPQADSHAELWLLDVTTAQRQRITGDADLRVPPVFDATGSALVYRSSASGGRQSLIRIDVATGTRRPVVEADTAFGIFPVGFARDGALIYASLSNEGTDLLAVAPGGTPRRLLHASDQLARDWRVSPAGDAVAYLAPVVGAERVTYRLHVARLDGSAPGRLGADAAGEQYGAAWRPAGDAVTVGQQPNGAPAASAATLPLSGSAPTLLTAPPRGFDHPLTWSADGSALAVRSFDGISAAAPGHETTAVIVGGQRRVVSGPAEIIVFGWVQ